jgi:hypothetical protein
MARGLHIFQIQLSMGEFLDQSFFNKCFYFLARSFGCGLQCFGRARCSLARSVVPVMQQLPFPITITIYNFAATSTLSALGQVGRCTCRSRRGGRRRRRSRIPRRR